MSDRCTARAAAAIRAGLAAALLLLTSCGPQKPEGRTGQVIATVGGEEVTTSELEIVRAASTEAGGPEDAAGERALLRVLVDRKILAQQATKARLDRDPAVLLRLRAAREDVLAQAYLASRMGGLAPPSLGEIDQFIAANPRLFGQHALLVVEKLTVADAEGFRAQVQNARSLDEIDRQARARGLAPSRSTASLDTAVLAPEIVDRLTAQKADEILLFEGAEGLTFVKLQAVDPKPVSGPAATELARSILGTRKAEAETTALRDQLRRDAGVVYLGKYAALMAGQDAAAPAGTGH